MNTGQFGLSAQIWELAKLTGRGKTDVPITILRQKMLLVKMIAEAHTGGASWATIGKALTGRPDAAAGKRIAKRLARESQRELIRRDA